MKRSSAGSPVCADARRSSYAELSTAGFREGRGSQPGSLTVRVKGRFEAPRRASAELATQRQSVPGAIINGWLAEVPSGALGSGRHAVSGPSASSRARHRDELARTTLRAILCEGAPVATLQPFCGHLRRVSVSQALGGPPLWCQWWLRVCNRNLTHARRYWRARTLGISLLSNRILASASGSRRLSRAAAHVPPVRHCSLTHRSLAHGSLALSCSCHSGDIRRCVHVI